MPSVKQRADDEIESSRRAADARRQGQGRPAAARARGRSSREIAGVRAMGDGVWQARPW